MNPITKFLSGFFGVAIRGQTYLNIFYLFLAFPLGLFYFIFLVVGFVLGFPLLVLLVGLLILLAVFAGWWALAIFERQMAIWLLKEDIPPMQPKNLAGQDLWNQIVAHLTNPITWTSLLFLVLKFPLGLLSFVVATTLIALTGGLLTAPFVYPFVPLQVWFTWDRVWQIDTLGEAMIAFVAGVFIGLISLHILNGLAWVSGRFARLMLGAAPRTAAPPTPAEALPVQ